MKAARGFWAITRVASGNFLEMYDFMVFGYFAGAIGLAYFPNRDPFLSLMASLTAFGVAFLMRPLGAIVLGAFADRHGRRAGLLLTLGLMGVGIVSLTVTPPYAAIGVAAPILVLAGRLTQGFSAGMELGGVSVYLAEIAPEGRKGFYVAWQSASQQVAVVAAGAAGLFITSILPMAAAIAWGWRLPLGLGCLIVPLLFALRRSMPETPAFEAQKTRQSWRDILAGLAASWRIVAKGVALVTMTTVSFYMITAYTPTFGVVALKLKPLPVFWVTLAVGVSNLVWLPVMGALSDRIGRKPLLIGCSLLMLVSTYPAMAWLASAPSFGRLLAVELWLSFLYASYNGAMVVALTEIVPEHLRTAGFSLAYSLATALFGGFTPAIAQSLIHWTGNRAMPGAWLALAAAVSLVAALTLRPLRPPPSPAHRGA